MSQFEQKPGAWNPELRPQASVLAVLALVFGLLSFCIPLIGSFVAIVLGALAFFQIANSGGKVTGKGLAVVGMLLGLGGSLLHIAILAALLLPAIQSTRDAAQRMQTSNNLKLIGIALHNYHDTYKSLPPSGVIYEAAAEQADLAPKLGLSWRVRILPFVEQFELYHQFDQHVPWDHPHNARLIERMPDVFKSPARPVDDGQTVYLGVVYPPARDPANLPDEQFRQYLTGTVFDHSLLRRMPGMQCVGFRHITDGTSNTIAVVEADADQAVIWTKPDDWEFDVADPSRGLGSLRPNGFMALYLDGSTTLIPPDVSADDLRRLFCRSDGESVNTSFPRP